MTPDIKRATELYIVDQLSLAVPGHVFVPFTGGSRTTGAVEIEPPFTVVSVSDANKVMATEGTWFCIGKAQVITARVEASSEEHAELARQVYAALSNIQPFISADFAFHGIDIDDMTTADDEASQAHADVISFTAGVGG